ncbi:hypothetical protein FHL15_005614 [Xylaria flabelliformis]|uniref:Uncharacterized protein n=1 Tax=Xylaria flabelliformis TaxID=2512241 RepID=A0A553HZG8_9PEZI|nr:hypothetical protein FHL15_005614 [Xylaria flabelliformis]
MGTQSRTKGKFKATQCAPIKPWDHWTIGFGPMAVECQCGPLLEKGEQRYRYVGSRHKASDCCEATQAPDRSPSIHQLAGLYDSSSAGQADRATKKGPTPYPYVPFATIRTLVSPNINIEIRNYLSGIYVKQILRSAVVDVLC